jgi:hypothetical protein
MTRPPPFFGVFGSLNIAVLFGTATFFRVGDVFMSDFSARCIRSAPKLPLASSSDGAEADCCIAMATTVTFATVAAALAASISLGA